MVNDGPHRQHRRRGSSSQVSPQAEGGARAPWFEVSCCPMNVARTLAAWQTYAASVDGDVVSLLQYAPATLSVELSDGGILGLRVRTGYPRDGVVEIDVLEVPSRPVALRLRVPAWAGGSTLGRTGEAPAVVAPGWALVAELAVGDTWLLTLPVAPRLSWPDPRIDAVRGTVAVERGPLVLCLESSGLPGAVDLSQVRLVVGEPLEDEADGAKVTVECLPGPAILPSGGLPFGALDGPATSARGDLSTAHLIPYHRWAQDGPTAMRVFLPVVGVPA